jgi:multicomponent Na+:H+ antiporter subunit F
VNIVWLCAAAALLPPFGLMLVLCGKGNPADRFVALQFCAGLAVLLFVMLDFGLGQPSFIDLPLALALLNVPGTLVLALFLERWL